MSKRRRNRRPGGHPATVAKRRARDQARSRIGIGTDELARRLVRQAPGIRSALEAEVWASSLLGAIWSRRDQVALYEDSPGYHLVVGVPLIEAIARAGGLGARIALLALATVDDTELALEARELADGLADEAEVLPAWVGALGKATITRAAVQDDVFGDACTVWLEARHPDGEIHAVGISIDNNLGAIATDVFLVDSIDAVAEFMRDPTADTAELTLEQLDPGVAAGRVHAAIATTDLTWDPPVSQEYAGRRALALRRGGEALGYVVATEPPELSRAERDRLLDEFLSAPEGAGFAADGEEAYVASLAIGFCADYVDGRPLRWSPEVVELFMADWVPSKVMADDEVFDCLPAALDAWVRFAGRKSSLPDWAIAATREAIPRWRETMVLRSSDPDVAGPAKEFLTAAREAGVDLENEDALKTFIAGWNARSAIA